MSFSFGYLMLLTATCNFVDFGEFQELARVTGTQRANYLVELYLLNSAEFSNISGVAAGQKLLEMEQAVCQPMLAN